MDNLEKKLWETHSKQVGDVNFDGKPIPIWENLSADRRASWRRACWVAVRKIFDEYIENE